MMPPVRTLSNVPSSQPIGRTPLPVPGGSGSAPTTLQPAAGADQGYIATGILLIKDWLVWLLSKILSFLKREEPTPAPPAALPPPVPPAVLLPAPELVEPIRREVALLIAFNKLSTVEQQCIQSRIGKARSWWHRTWLFPDDRTFGGGEIQSNPAVLKQYMVPPT